jgi:hypothetical protein
MIYSEEPLGEQQAVLDPKEWNGCWATGSLEGSTLVLGIVVVDSEKGIVALGGCDTPSPSPDFQVQLRLARRQNEWIKWYFPTLIHATGKSDAAHGGLYSYGGLFGGLLLIHRGSTLLLHVPAEKRIRSLIEQGVLPGRVDGNKVILGRLQPEHYEILLSVEEPLVEWDRPDAYVRFPAELRSCKKSGQSE